MTGYFLSAYVDRIFAAQRLPPKAAVPVSAGRHSFGGQKAAALIYSKAAVHNGRVKMLLLYDGFFSFAVVRQIDLIIKERADNSSSKVLLVIGSASVRLAL